MHAYLILAHGNWDLLAKTLALYDDARNDIYLHIDANIRNVPFERLKGACRRSRVEFVRRIPVVYLTYSLSDATFELLAAATGRRSYDYYHLLSGQDLPLATQDNIHAFFRGALKEVGGRRVPANFVSVWEGPETSPRVTGPCITPITRGSGTSARAAGPCGRSFSSTAAPGGCSTCSGRGGKPNLTLTISGTPGSASPMTSRATSSHDGHGAKRNFRATSSAPTRPSCKRWS